MKILVGPLRQLDSLIERHRPSHVVTLLAPGSEVPPCPTIAVDRRLTLLFHDLTAPTPPLLPPDRATIRRLLDFATAWDERAPLLVHCWAGVSRSPAAAFILACARSAPGQELGIAQALRRASPFATPNALMVALADEALGREGRMIAAVEAIGRGADCGEGVSFALTRAQDGWL
jgi:predicted protein tyrosine phosphatase